MSTTLYPFSGNEQKSMIFTPVLDGEVYNCQTKWNVASQRWYLNITDNSGNRLLTTPMVGSPVGYDINLLVGAFTISKMVWRYVSGQIEVIN
ncbi:phage baseplate plug family protein [Serratia marcescens]|uniref:phage baseplate plug family protein n=1 Tax=Serratia marcescens TaxID=615 RepID=UPI003AAFADE6